jgi:tRNA-splicing ligase RtcB
LTELKLEELVVEGAKLAVEKGYGTSQDLESIEEGGRLAGAKFEALSPKSVSRARRQVGTLGSGNHFIEFQKVDQIFDQKIASDFGLFPNQLGIMLHSGSRALGHQTCTDYTEIFWEAKDGYQIEVPRKGLAALPLETKEAQDYFAAMAASVNFAFANRQIMTHFIRKILTDFFQKENPQLNLLYDVAHNIAKWEPFDSTWGKPSSLKKILIHRKGATRALPAGHPLLPTKFKDTGQPAIIPGSMGTASYVLVGTPKAAETFFSVNHGAGRLMSRGEAFRSISKEKFEDSMRKVIYNLPFHRIADEAPDAYKDIDEVVETLVEAGITQKVAKLTPLAVVKGD